MRPRISRTVITIRRVEDEYIEAPAIITRVDDWEDGHRINVTAFPDGMTQCYYQAVRLFSCRSSAVAFLNEPKRGHITVCYWPDRD